MRIAIPAIHNPLLVLLVLFLGGCAASSRSPAASSPWAGFALEPEDAKRTDDKHISSLVAGRMEFAKVILHSSDGLPVPAYLFTPLGSGKELRSALIYLHGGEHGTFSSHRVELMMRMVAQGWVVLALDYRGSSGYGQVFYDAADYGGREIDDILAARDWLEEDGLADPERIAILGSSHGGYNAVMAVARRPRGFAACVDFYGPTDLVYRVTSTSDENPNASPGDAAKFARMVGATIQQDEKAYRDRSPRFVADRIQTPLFIVHGTLDGVVEIQESEWLVEALRSAGHPDFVFLRVDGGKHGYPTEAYRPAWDRVFEFLEDRLGDSNE